jgi:hypothetical protein
MATRLIPRFDDMSTFGLPGCWTAVLKASQDVLLVLDLAERASTSQPALSGSPIFDDQNLARFMSHNVLQYISCSTIRKCLYTEPSFEIDRKFALSMALAAPRQHKTSHFHEF